MSNKICPSCNTTNYSGNLKCIKCNESLLYVTEEKEWTEEHEQQPFRKIYLWDEFISFSFIVRVILAIIFTYTGISILNPFLLGLAIITFGTFFIPKDFDFFSPTDWHSYFKHKEEIKNKQIEKLENKNNEIDVTKIILEKQKTENLEV